MNRPTSSSLALEFSEDTARREIEDFVQALSSYPERFAHDPRLSFAQYLDTIMSTDRKHHA